MRAGPESDVSHAFLTSPVAAARDPRSVQLNGSLGSFCAGSTGQARSGSLADHLAWHDSTRERREPPGDLANDAVDLALREALATSLGADAPRRLERIGAGRYRLAGRRVYCRLSQDGHLLARRDSGFIPIAEFLASVAPCAERSNRLSGMVCA